MDFQLNYNLIERKNVENLNFKYSKLLVLIVLFVRTNFE